MSIPTSTASLARLANIVDADLGGVDELPTGESASLIRVARNGEVAIKSLDGQHPFDALLGFVAPEDWEVLGVIAPGWGTRLVTGERLRTRVIYLAGRDGEEASLIRFAGDDDGEVLRLTERTIGRVADCVRRALDLPTTPEPEDGLLALWFHRVLQRMAACNHPSFGGRKLAPTDVGVFIDDARPVSWNDERWAVIQHEGSDLMTGDLAAWMDEGMYARFVLAEFADPDVAIPAAKRACIPEGWEAVLRHFAAAALSPEQNGIQ